MNSTFRSRALALFLAVFVTTLLATGGALMWQVREQAAADGHDQLASGLRVLGELYATRRTQMILDGRRFASDRSLLRAVKSANTQSIIQYLARRISFDDGRFVVVFTRAGERSRVAGSAGPVPDLDALTRLVAADASAQTRIESLDGHLVQFAITPDATGNTLVVNGFAVNRGLAKRMRTITGIEVGFRSATAAFGSGFEPIPGEIAVSGSIVLDAVAGRELVADLAVSKHIAFANFDALMAQAMALAAAAIGLGTLMLSILLTRTVRKQLEQPLASLRAGVQRAMQGDFSKPVLAPAGTAYGPMIRAFNDMQTKLAAREGRIVHHAQYDTLTGLTNRSVVDERIKVALAKAQRSGGTVAAITLDITRFNEINDSLGHETGDEVLKEVARRLASNTRVSDTVARVGGDEFFVLLEDTDQKLASHMAEFLVASIESPIRVGEHEVRLCVHSGLALYPSHCETLEALRRMANIALLTAKEQNRRVVLYEPGQDEKQLRELAIIHDLPNAIANGELYLQYQPKIDVETQRVNYVEALVRWRHPQLGFIPPDEFVALLEKSGNVDKLTEWVFKEALRQSAEWSGAGYDFGIAINISANDLSDESLPARVQTLLRHYLVDAGRISVEVTESAVIRDPARSVGILREFRKIGIKVALDDFGTGQTSLALLKQLPLSELKIDKSFVQNLRANSGDAIIVKSIIDLGHNMGLVVTAEGVESNYCWNLLNSYSCDLVQGYLVSAPLTSDELSQWYLRLQDRHVNTIDFSFVQDMSA